MRSLLRSSCLLCLVVGCSTTDLQSNSSIIDANTIVDFGSQPVKASVQQTLLLNNHGNTVLTVSQPTGNTMGGVFTAALPSGIDGGSVQINAGGSIQVVVTFAPQAAQMYSTVFTFPNTSQNEPMLQVTFNGTGVNNDPCEGITCDSPPAPSCSDSSTSQVYSAQGTCSDGACMYTSTPTTCQFGCNASTGLCSSDPCAGMACNTPPAATCADANDSRTYSLTGTCTAGTCSYTPTVTACMYGCITATGFCNENPCSDVTCDSPPAPSCTDGGLSDTYEATGTCEADGGWCSYKETPVTCSVSCDATTGKCVCSDPCPDAGMMGCIGNGVATCGQTSDGCLDWGTPVACGSNQTCTNGACVNNCTNACTMGTFQCVGNSVEACNNQGNGCLGWSVPVACGENQMCSAATGTCMTIDAGPTCTDECTADAKQCVTGGLETCVTGTGPMAACLVWSTPDACPANETCVPGQTECSCANTSCGDACCAAGDTCVGNSCCAAPCGNTCCGSGESCAMNVANEPVCAQSCTTSSQCGSSACCTPALGGGGACITGALCLCTYTSECANGPNGNNSICAPETATGPYVCKPDGSGTGVQDFAGCSADIIPIVCNDDCWTDPNGNKFCAFSCEQTSDCQSMYPGSCCNPGTCSDNFDSCGDVGDGQMGTGYCGPCQAQ